MNLAMLMKNKMILRRTFVLELVHKAQTSLLTQLNHNIFILENN